MGTWQGDDGEDNAVSQQQQAMPARAHARVPKTWHRDSTATGPQRSNGRRVCAVDCQPTPTGSESHSNIRRSHSTGAGSKIRALCAFFKTPGRESAGLTLMV